MSEPISQSIVSSFSIGMLTGIIYGISKKLWALIWGLAALTFIVVYFISTPEEIAISLNWGVWNWITMLIVVNISFLIGSNGVDIIKSIFSNNGYR
jgi:hypothetical protein